MFRLLCIFLWLGFAAPFRPTSLKCPPCDVSQCLPIDSCMSGITWDVCHCCETCGKSLGEECGGPWNAYGQCGYGLKCFKDVRECPYLFTTRSIRSAHGNKMCEEYIFNAIGRCVQNSDVMTVLKRFGFLAKNFNVPSESPPQIEVIPSVKNSTRIDSLPGVIDDSLVSAFPKGSMRYRRNWRNLQL